MKQFFSAVFLFVLTFCCHGNTIIVKNIEELNTANKNAMPGDIIVLQNGEWKSVTIKLNCQGTREKPITFKAQTAGKVLITGNSSLKIGGSFIIVDGLYFTNGYAGKEDVITFRVDSKQLANNCRVTNTAINDFNNPKRTDENYWLAFYGKNNRLDHCSFIDKKNIGVLLAVVLDDDRSRENFHSIDHNYFGRRLPLASNGGEIIRVGVSEHCQFNSNTRITNNFFEHCDGETEIISIKSCANEVKENLFKQCQGAVVLRHGNDNLVANNIFLGYNKEGTGGVRVINKGQWIVNNFFYECRGTGFRSPLSVMNGIPNSPANRYVQVTDAVIANNTFYDCAPVSLCEGSDTERTLPPANVYLFNNSFYNNTDTNIYKTYDDIKGFSFLGNYISNRVQQKTTGGFHRVFFSMQKWEMIGLPLVTSVAYTPNDSLQQVAKKRLGHELSARAGFSNLTLLKEIAANAYSFCGAKWLDPDKRKGAQQSVTVSCKNSEDIYRELATPGPVTLRLSSTEFLLNTPVVITKPVQLTSDKKNSIKFLSGNMVSAFMISGNGNLRLENLIIDGSDLKASHFISSDSAGSSDHYNLTIRNCSIQNFKSETGCHDIFYAFKHIIADSILIHNNSFVNNSCNFFSMNDENENRGYYNAEKIFIGHNNFVNQSGSLVDVYRGGNDESTLGPHFTFSHNRVQNCNHSDALIKLTGVQITEIFSNSFSDCNPSGDLIFYKDHVRARHYLGQNKVLNSGKIEKNNYVDERVDL